ncbi:hypothetical protein OUZ56_005713 [Daphnia magna]|uniref:Uncharacterized protein n=1 Tax=Daphnia magna TaxID=35525 RepID=A0ABQ9YTJ4_9CRUS|nr:hypothetical protein OUZ56_005713 [Daphnia magna]
MSNSPIWLLWEKDETVQLNEAVIEHLKELAIYRALSPTLRHTSAFILRKCRLMVTLITGASTV